MSGVTFEQDYASAHAGLARLDLSSIHDLVFGIGELMVGQTKERISTEKSGPDGEAWPAWSKKYAAKRKAHHSLLIGEGEPGLRESIANHSSGTVARIGTNLIYGAVHQFGFEDNEIPARPYLGLSDENRTEIEDLVVNVLEDRIHA